MKRLTILTAMAALALVMSIDAAMADPCSGPGCSARPEPAPFQTAGPCTDPNCARPEPVVTSA